MLLIFVFPVDAVAVALNVGDSITADDMNEINKQISELQSQRSFLRMEKYRQSNSETFTTLDDGIDKKIQLIDTKLEKLGVRKVSPNGSAKSVQTRGIEAPESTNEEWSLYVYSSVYSEGVRYEISVLTAESANTSSVLYDSGAKVIHAAPGIAAGSADYMRICGTAASGIVGTVFGTIFDAVSTMLTNLSTSTVIKNVSATYNWQTDTLMHYVYVKVWGTSAQPELCYVYNEVNALVLGVTAHVKFGGKDYSNDKLNYDTYEKRSNRIMSYNASLLSNAIDCYLNYYQVMHSFVSYITITGADNKNVTKHSVCQTVYPGQLY